MAAHEDDFAGFERAELMHARGLAAPVAEQICARYLDHGTWRRAPDAWTLLADRTSERDGATRDRLGWFEAWLDAVRGEPVEQAHDQVLRDVIGWLIYENASAEVRLRVAEKLVAWLCAHAGPGSAGCSAYVLERVYSQTWPADHRDEAMRMDARLFAEAFTPLARRLVEVGVAELRSGSHDRLMADIVRALERNGPPELLVAAFEIMIAAGHDLKVWWDYERPLELWWLAEAALEAGLSPTRCWDIVTRVELRDMRRVWAPLLLISFPRCAKALASGLACAGIPRDTARVGWPAMVLLKEPEALEEPLTEQAATLLVEVLSRDVMMRVDRYEVRRYLDENDAVNRERIAHWVVFAAGMILQMAGPARAQESRRFVARHLSHLASAAWTFDDVGPNRDVASALREWIEAADNDDRSLALVARILRENPVPTIAARAALECLSRAPSGAAVSASDEWLTSLHVEFERFVNLPWNDPAFGIDMKAALGGVTNVVFQDDASQQVEAVGSTLKLQPSYYAGVFRERGPSDEALALCMLYFVHEFLHISQGVGELATIQRLRAVGAELTLMHLDLAADHAALLLTHRAVPRWSLTWLLRLVSTSLESFPASSFHTQAARHRKAVRLVSTRAALLAREQQPGAVDRMGYLFVDYSPAGGGLFLLAYGPPLRVLAQIDITADESRLLNDAADPRQRENAAKRDVVLNRLVAAWRPTA